MYFPMTFRPHLVIVLTSLNVLFIALSLLDYVTPYKPTFTYIGDDFPSNFPLPPIGTVELILEESSRFHISNNSLDAWWDNLPVDFGYVRLGPEHRIFAVSMFHQHHCLYLIAKALAKGPLSRHDIGHVQHCMNYLRQNILCNADTTLESPDWTHRNFTVQRVLGGRPRTCQDWSEVRRFVAENFDEWMQFKREHFGTN